MKRAAIALAVLLVTRGASAGKQCVEVSEVLGERRCGRFGDFWSTERAVPIFGAIGSFNSVTQPVGPPFLGKLQPYGESLDAGRFVAGPIRAHGIDLRIGGYFARYGYVGFDWAFALGHASGQPFELGGHHVGPASGVNFFQGRVAPIVGVRAPLGRVSLRLELLTGLQLMFLSHVVRRADGGNSGGGTGGATWLLEPRMAADVWLTPDTTLSLWAGSNLARTGDAAFGLSLGGHFRAFDGTF